MEYQETTDEQIEKKEQGVQHYLNWIQRTDTELTEVQRETPLRIKPVNRTMVQNPVW